MGSIEHTTQFDFKAAYARLDFSAEGIEEKGLEYVINNSPLRKKTLQSAAEKEKWQNDLWSLHQRAAKPNFVFQPTDARDVAIMVLLCRQTKTKFAVKSGGHAAFKGASNADGGVTIDMKNLDGVILNKDKSIAGIGPGNTWEPVFKKLREDGLAVAGGRAGCVGVGGYSLGGGISFFASSRGWACDNIRNYEFVNADGEILNVNYKSYPDLFWALRGGGNNFGIVTRFDYEAFPQEDIYSGSRVFDYEHRVEVIKGFNNAAINSDPKSATWLISMLHEGKKMFSVLSMLAETSTESEIFKAYEGLPVLNDTFKVRSMADMAHEIAGVQVQNHQQNYWNTTFKFDPEFVAWMVDSFYGIVEPFSGKFESDQPVVLVLQYITKETVQKMQREGGNCLPFKEEEAPYVNMLTPTAWKHEKDDEMVIGFLRKIHGQAAEEGKRRGLYVDYVYMNYASLHQDVLKGYGEENYNKLKEIALKYDPEGVFQKLVPGYFKFGGSPA